MNRNEGNEAPPTNGRGEHERVADSHGTNGNHVDQSSQSGDIVTEPQRLLIQEIIDEVNIYMGKRLEISQELDEVTCAAEAPIAAGVERMTHLSLEKQYDKKTRIGLAREVVEKHFGGYLK